MNKDDIKKIFGFILGVNIALGSFLAYNNRSGFYKQIAANSDYRNLLGFIGIFYVISLSLSIIAIIFLRVKYKEEVIEIADYYRKKYNFKKYKELTAKGKKDRIIYFILLFVIFFFFGLLFLFLANE